MKHLIQLLALAGFVATSMPGYAAPRAAEDPSAVVISTSESAPVVKRQAPKQTTATPKKKAGSKSTKSPASKKAKPAKKATKR